MTQTLFAAVREHLRCPHCDYDLYGLTLHRCPECGEAFDLEELRLRPPPSRWDVFLARLQGALAAVWLVTTGCANVHWSVIPHQGTVYPHTIVSLAVLTLPFVLPLALCCVLFARRLDRRIAGWVYLLSTLGLGWGVWSQSGSPTSFAVSRLLLWSCHVWLALLMGLLVAKCRAILVHRASYGRVWRQDLAFVAFLVVMAAATAFVLGCLAEQLRLANYLHIYRSMQWPWDEGVAALLYDSVLAAVLMPLTLALARGFHVELDKPIDMTVLTRRRGSRSDTVAATALPENTSSC